MWCHLKTDTELFLVFKMRYSVPHLWLYRWCDVRNWTLKSSRMHLSKGDDKENGAGESIILIWINVLMGLLCSHTTFQSTLELYRYPLVCHYFGRLPTYSDQFLFRLPIDISVNQHLTINHSNDRLVNETNKINHSMGLFTWKIFTLKDHSHKHSTALSKRGTFIRLFAQTAKHPNRLSAQHSIEISSMSAATGWKLMNGIDESNQLLFKKQTERDES